MQFCLAVALIDRQVGLRQFTDEKVNQPMARELMAKTRMVVSPKQPANGVPPTVVRVTLRDGRTVSRQVDRAKGQPQNPLSDEELVAKYLDCAATVLGPQEAKSSLQMMQQLEDMRNIGELMDIVVAR
jgi:2-methylcitrate dehydratase PrpD